MRRGERKKQEGEERERKEGTEGGGESRGLEEHAHIDSSVTGNVCGHAWPLVPHVQTEIQQ